MVEPQHSHAGKKAVAGSSRAARTMLLSELGVLMYMESAWNDAVKRNDMAWFDRNYASDATAVSSRTG